MLISIVIPVFNVEPFIVECLQSVMRQTYTGPLECIIVDDCGTDRSMAIAEQLIAEYVGPIEFHIVHHEFNRGLSAARNTGTDIAMGVYVYYLDSDDYISEDCIALLVEPLKERDYDIVVGDYEMFGDRRDPTLLLEQRKEIIGNDAIFESYAERQIYVMSWNKLCKKSFLCDNGISFLEGQLHEDELWTYRVMLHVQSIAIVKKVLYWYRVRAMSIATDPTKAKEKVHSYFDTLQEIHQHPHNKANAYYKCLSYYWCLFLYLSFSNKVDFKNYYKVLRSSCPYHPLSLYKYGELSLLDVKKKIHFILPPNLGYLYLCLRNYKNSKFR